ncbi:unnamed protein product [Lymnaea stagnalis]|uniref:LolA-like domain-containing protein n=1 Tax=Lymnaea stagnalis TaxID=6523 RepID=A0AAV2I8D6_LYMST
MKKSPKLRLLLVILQLVSWAYCSFDWHTPSYTCASTHTPRADPWVKLYIPNLPSQYSMKVEANIVQKNWTTEVEEHYDAHKSRASLSLTFNGSTTVSIFDYTIGEKYNIYPNGTCQTDVPTFDVYGYTKMGKLSHPALATVYEVFHFGTGFNQTYIGKEVVRGIPVDHWTSCQEWPDVGAKFQLDYYFSDPDYTMAGGVTQVPVRAVLNGSANNLNADMKKLTGTHHFTHIYDFTSFRAGPVLNEDVFRIPPGVVCRGKVNSKAMPSLPPEFEVSMEVIIPDSSLPPRQQFLRFDYEHELIETWSRMLVPEGFDFRTFRSGATTPTPKSLEPNKLTLLTISTVEDYRNEIVYVLNKGTMSCSIHAMTDGLYETTMAHGPSLFQVVIGTNEFVYQGQTNIRDMLVDVWAMESDGISQEVYFSAEDSEEETVDFSERVLKRSAQPSFTPTLVGMLLKNRTAVNNGKLSPFFKEIFATSNDSMTWSGLSDDAQANVPTDKAKQATGDQTAWGLQLERSLNQRISEKLVHFFHFSPAYTVSTQFQISSCYSDEETATVTFLVNASYSVVEKSYYLFKNALRSALARESKLSILQISNLYTVPMKNNSYATYYVPQISLTLLGRPPVKNSKQVPLMLAKDMLHEAVKNGIAFYVSYSTAPTWFDVDRNTFSLRSSNDTLDPETFFSSYGNDKPFKDSGNTSENGSATLYTPGAVAGIAFGMLVLGAALCLTVVYLLYRRRHPGQSFIPYRLTN